MLDVNKLIAYLDEMIEKTDITADEEFKPEKQRKAGANDAFRAVRVLVKNAIDETTNQ